ncbi:undecaprenyl-diphosphate phosphatase [Priestia megaterium]
MSEPEFIYIIKLIIIGLVQGFTEPIPVSSSGNVMIVSEIWGLGKQGSTFATLTNTALLLAIIYIYRQDIIRIMINSIYYLKSRFLTGNRLFKI